MLMELSQYALNVTNHTWFALCLLTLSIYFLYFFLSMPGILIDDISGGLFSKFLDTKTGMALIIAGALISGICVIILAIAAPAYISKSSDVTTSKYIKDGKYYTDNCTLIEENINNGFFSSNTNKLQCGKTIKNITTDSYNNAVNAYMNAYKNTNINQPRHYGFICDTKTHHLSNLRRESIDVIESVVFAEGSVDCIPTQNDMALGDNRYLMRSEGVFTVNGKEYSRSDIGFAWDIITERQRQGRDARPSGIPVIDLTEIERKPSEAELKRRYDMNSIEKLVILKKVEQYTE